MDLYIKLMLIYAWGKSIALLKKRHHAKAQGIYFDTMPFDQQKPDRSLMCNQEIDFSSAYSGHIDLLRDDNINSSVLYSIFTSVRSNWFVESDAYSLAYSVR